jgi:IS6 family transposase
VLQKSGGLAPPCYDALVRKLRPALFKWRHFEPAIITCAVGWYLRFSLSYRDVEALLIERGISADHTTIWRWVQGYAPALNQRCRRELKPTNGSWRVDETYVRAKGKWVYLYRAVDSGGATIDFLLSAHRDAAAAKRFFQRALRVSGRPRPRVINVDGNPSYPKAVTELKTEGNLGRRCRCRTCPYLNNLVEQDHRAIKRRVHASQGFRSFSGAWRTIQGYEVMHMIRKGQVRWLPKGDVLGLVLFLNEVLGLRTE